MGQDTLKVDIHGKIIESNAMRIPTNSSFKMGEVIVRFENDYLDTKMLYENQQRFKREKLIRQNINGRKSNLNNFLSNYNVSTMRRAITKLRPNHTHSTTRDGRTVSIPKLYNLMVLEIPKNIDIIKFCHKLNQEEGVIYAEPNYIITLDNNITNDTNFNLQLGFEQQNNHDIDACLAWDFSTGSNNVKVGVIDTGIDYDNIDLGNGNWGNNNDKVRGGWDFRDNDADPDDDMEGHGTSVAGIIGALRNNGQGVAGLAGGDGMNNQGVQLFALKVFGTGPATIDKFIDAVTEASISTPTFGYGCHILNNSWGSLAFSEAFREAVHVASQNNVVFVAAKGNNNNTAPHYPSDYEDYQVIAVGATTALDLRVNATNFAGPFQWGSSFGNDLDVMAPGNLNNVFTTGIGNNTFVTFNGTSAAAPHVAGLAALLLSENPTLHAQDVEGIIEASSNTVRQDVYNYINGYNEEMGHGRIDAGRALEMLQNPWQLQHSTSTGGYIQSTSELSMQFRNTFGGLLDNGNYYVKRHEVRKTIVLPHLFQGQYFSWGRGSGASTGWASGSPNYQNNFCEVIAQTATSITLRSYVYEVYERKGIAFISLGWHPTTPSNVTFGYTTLGIPGNPILNVNINGSESLSKGQFANYSANVSGGTGSYTYRWFRRNDFGTEILVGTSSSYSLNMPPNISLNVGLRLEVRSGSQTKNDYKYIYCNNCGDNCDIIRSVEVYPNPFTNQKNITIKIIPCLYSNKDATKYQVKIFDDSNGKLVLEEEFRGDEHKLNTSKLFSNGEYVLHILSNGRLVTKHLIRQ